MIYKINMSKGDAIMIDEQDLEKLEANIGEKLIRLKQGIINPSFMISIVPQEKIDEYIVKPIIERRGDKMVVTGETKTPRLGDLMNKNLLNGKA